MIGAFIKAVNQLSDVKTRSVIWMALITTTAVFAGLWTATGYLISETVLFDWGWLETAVDMLGGIATLVVTWFLFPAIASTVIGLLLEHIADAVEARHYPHLPDVRGLAIGETLSTVGKFLAAMIVLNLMLLPLLVVPLFWPVLPFAFYAVNGYLLSREYFELIALRRVAPAEARSIRRSHRLALFSSGVVIAFLLTVPVVNLFAPVIATAAMVHLFEKWRHLDHPDVTA